MDLKDLPSRYTKVAPDKLQGDQAAAELVGGVKVLKQKDLREMVRPGFIDWDDSIEQVSFNMRPTPKQIAKSEANLQQMLDSGNSPDYLNGLGQSQDTAPATATTQAVSTSAVAAPESHLGRKVICAIIFMVIGFAMCHIVHRKGWM